jgi:hypothetical protein
MSAGTRDSEQEHVRVSRLGNRDSGRERLSALMTGYPSHPALILRRIGGNGRRSPSPRSFEPGRTASRRAALSHRSARAAAVRPHAEGPGSTPASTCRLRFPCRSATPLAPLPGGAAESLPSGVGLPSGAGQLRREAGQLRLARLPRRNAERCARFRPCSGCRFSPSATPSTRCDFGASGMSSGPLRAHWPTRPPPSTRRFRSRPASGASSGR